MNNARVPSARAGRLETCSVTDEAATVLRVTLSIVAVLLDVTLV